MDPHQQLPLQVVTGSTYNFENLGRGLVFAALIFMVLTMLGNLLSGKFAKLEKFSKWTFGLGCFTLFGAFGTLGYLIFTEQYQFTYVFRHTDRSLEAPYKVAAIWAGQEGSFLLWATSCAIFGLWAAARAAQFRRWFTFAYAGFLACLAGILSYESPFKVELIEGKYLPPDGSGMTPALINYWITIHPPVIFLGFGMLTVLYAFAVSALLGKSTDNWAALIRPWVISSATLLGVGLCMGGLWAYETLGWGGFWAWDPVENTSFVPWLWTVMLIHGLFVQVARNKWAGLNIFLAATSLITFVYGTFLTRSGVYGDQSVHSFAQMDPQAEKILVWILGVFAGGFAVLYLTRLKWLKSLAPAPGASEEGVLNRETSYSATIILLMGLAIGAGIGMSVPLINTLQGQAPKAVEEAVYNRTLVYLFIPTVIAMAIGPYLSWKNGTWKSLTSKIANALTLSFLALAGLIFWLKFGVSNAYKLPPDDSVFAPIVGSIRTVPWILTLSFLCLFGIAANFLRLVQLGKRSKGGIGGLVTHIGVIVIMLGLILSRGLQQKVQTVVQAGTPGVALGYLIELQSTQGKNFMKRGNTVDFKFKGPDGEGFLVKPELYYTIDNKGEPKGTIHPSIQLNPTHDIYVAVYPMAFDAGDPVTLKPGETKEPFEGMKIAYKGLIREGEAGMTGTKFLADLEITTEEGTFPAKPGMQLNGGAPPSYLSSDLPRFTATMEKMDAKDKSVTIQLFYKDPLYPLDVYYKPFTILVWLGTGIMLIGGFWAAWYRRKNLRTPVTETESNTVVEETPENSNTNAAFSAS